MKRQNRNCHKFVFTSLSLLLLLAGCESNTGSQPENSHEDVGVHQNLLNLTSGNMSGNSAPENGKEELRSLQNLRDGTFLSITVTEIPISQGASKVDVKPALVSPLNSTDLIIRSNWFLERNGISVRLKNAGNSFFVKNMCLDAGGKNIALTKCDRIDENSNLDMRPLDNGAVVLTAKGPGDGDVFRCLGATRNQEDVGKLELTLDACLLSGSVDPRFQWVVTATQTPSTTKLFPAGS